MSDKPGQRPRSLRAGVVLMLTLLAGGGCSDKAPTADAGTPASAEELFTADEIAAMKKSAGSGPAYRQLLRMKILERQGTAKVKYPLDKGKASGKG
ncbi:MAG: hypothetical protein P4L84_23960 [Isosphaeraceae bacterium]|nr:hypothetical protein [Isosphaeraceae bacterium]